MNPSLIWNSLLESFRLNGQIFAVTLALGLPLGLLISFGAMSRLAPLRAILKIFVWIMRGTPLMLQIIIVF
ncbi:MAG: amino acid ABC transporter permease, partial [Firmicutes bacterium]|nr:amino acid ABC transporter permease [Bacillota bacterium]